MNKDIEDIFTDWSQEYRGKFLIALEAIAALYDAKYDSYPEHMFEGLSVLCFFKDVYECKERAEWMKRIGY